MQFNDLENRLRGDIAQIKLFGRYSKCQINGLFKFSELQK